MKLIKIVHVKRVIDALLKFVDDDAVLRNESDSWLYRMLFDITDDSNFNFYEQAKAIFLNTKLSPRKIQTGIGYNLNTNGSPYIHIRELQRTPGTYNNIGGIGDNVYLNSEQDYTSVIYRDARKSDYEIVVTSDNQLATILITDVIYALLIGASASLYNEFDLVNFSIKDMMVNMSTNAQLYAKSIVISTQYENQIPSIILDPVQTGIVFQLTSLNDENLVLGD